MKTTIDIPEKVLSEVITFSGAKTKREAILTALHDYIRKKKAERAVAMLGTFDLDIDDDNETINSNSASSS